MNRFIKVAMLLSIVTVLLTALSFKTAEASTNVSPCQPCQSRFITQPAATPFRSLNGVAAISANDVWAVGYRIDLLGGQPLTLFEHWNGTTWSIVKSPSPGTSSNFLSGIAAVSTSDVWAVGSFSNNTNSSQTLIEHWNGSKWSIVKSPNPVGGPFNNLSEIAIISPSNIWAVGNSGNNTSSQTLTEHWNGSKWSIVKSPNPGTSSGYLSGVAAVSTSDVWAVGSSFNSSSNSTLVEHWNGSKWSIVKSPSPGTQGSFLNGVTAVSANNVWAVGDSFNSTSSPTLIEHWNGSKWSVVKSPNPTGSPGSVLDSVVAVSASDIWAVGNYIAPTRTQTLIEHWNGSKWSVVKSPNAPGATNNALLGIAIVSASDIWAVGFSSNSSNVGSTLIAHWNGSTWSIVKSPTTVLSNFN